MVSQQYKTMDSKVLNTLKNGSATDIIEELESVSDIQLEKIRSILDDKYYNSETPLISDEQYDIFYDYIISRIPSSQKIVGSKFNCSSSRVSLPKWIGSLDKKKDQKGIDRWSKKYTGSYFISEKLDGISLLVEFGETFPKLYTRGDGHIGGNVTHLSEFIKFPIGASNPLRGYDRGESGMIVRGELIISSDKFEAYKELYDNSRQMVAGIVNAKSLKKGIEDIEFVAHQIMTSPQPIGVQYQQLKTLGFKIPQFTVVEKLQVDELTGILYQMKKTSRYSIDGIVVTDNNPHPINTSGNPDYAWAFKIIGDIYTSTVEDVEWNLSRTGILKPIIKITPVKMKDVTVCNVTGFNAKYIKDNSIGVGTVVRIVRSGDVIPHIVDICQQSSHPALPDIKYKWNSSGVDIIADLENDDELWMTKDIKNLAHFCAKLKIMNLGESTVAKLYKNGWNTLYKILDSRPDSFSKIKGLGTKSSIRIHQSIRRAIPMVTLSQFLGASGVIGQGIAEKKVMTIIESYPYIFTEEIDRGNEEYYKIIGDLGGFGDVTVSKFVKNIKNIKKLVEEYDKFFKFGESQSKPLPKKTEKDLCVVFSGFRDKELENMIRGIGGKIMGNISKGVNYVIVKDINNVVCSSKINKANEYGIKIVDKNFIVENLFS